MASVAGGCVECARLSSAVGSSTGNIALAVLVYTMFSGPAGARLAASLVLAAGASHALKALLDMPRPPPEEWLAPAVGAGMPSGHAAGAAALAVSLAPWTRDRPLLAVALVAHAAAVSASRLTLRVHYPADVVGGALVGVAAALLVHAAARRGVPALLVAAGSTGSALAALAYAVDNSVYGDLSLVAGAGLGLAASAPLLARALACVEGGLQARARLAALAVSVAASAPSAAAEAGLDGLLAGLAAGLLVPLSRPLACRLARAAG